jgi:hypothetical protein
VSAPFVRIVANDGNSYHAVASPPKTAKSPAREANAGDLITADASKMSGLAFMDATGVSSPEKRAADRLQMQQQCIRAIERGDTYGWPPMMVAECRKLMEARS